MLRTPELRHRLVAGLHLPHRPLQRDDGLAGLRHHRRQQVRDVVVNRKLQHLGVDQDQLALVRRQPIEQRQDHAVDRNRLARAGGAGDQQVRHACEVGHHRVAADVLAEREGQVGFRALVCGARQQLAQQHGLALTVGQLDADDATPGDRGGAHRNRAHRACDVVGEPDHPRSARARLRLELVERDHWSRPDLRDLAEDPEILEHGDQHLRVLLERVFARVGRRVGAIRVGEKRERRQRVFCAVLKIECGLTLLLLPLAGLHPASRLLDDAGLGRPLLNLPWRRRKQARLASARGFLG